MEGDAERLIAELEQLRALSGEERDALVELVTAMESEFGRSWFAWDPAPRAYIHPNGYWFAVLPDGVEVALEEGTLVAGRASGELWKGGEVKRGRIAYDQFGWNPGGAREAGPSPRKHHEQVSNATRSRR